MNDSSMSAVPSAPYTLDNMVVVPTSTVPPPPNRRPRVREVSSRFMSPQVSSSPDNHHRSRSVLRRRQEQEHQLFGADENITETSRSLDSPLGGPHHTNALNISTNKPLLSLQRKQRVLFKENGGGGATDQQNHHQMTRGKSSRRRQDTPILNTAMLSHRVVPSKYKLTTRQNFSDAAKLLHANEMSGGHGPISEIEVNSAVENDNDSCINGSNICTVGDEIGANDSDTCSVTSQESTCHVSIANNKTRVPMSDMRSSMPEVDARWLAAERSCSSSSSNGGNVSSEREASKYSASPCFRSLTLPPISSSEHSKASSMNAVKTRGLCLPPNPTCIKAVGAEGRKGRVGFNHQEQLHSLKLLHNHYLQWRYANAKAEASMIAQKRETERQLYSVEFKISDIRNIVSKKRIELGLLQRTRTLSTILEAHMQYLEEWSAFGEEYSTSLSGAVSALLNSSLRLPVSGNVRADVREVGDALNSASKVLEMIGVLVQSFMPKAEEMDTLISELARVTNGERALTEECGNFVFRTYTSQVEECSLKGHLIQLHCSNHCQPPLQE